MLIKADIQAYLKKRREELAAALDVTPEKVIASHAMRAFFDPRKLLDPETGMLIPLHRLPREVAAAVTKIKVRNLRPIIDAETGEELKQDIIEVEWDNGNVAREALSKFVGLYKEDHKQANAGLMTAAEFVRAIRADIDGWLKPGPAERP